MIQKEKLLEAEERFKDCSALFIALGDPIRQKILLRYLRLLYPQAEVLLALIILPARQTEAIPSPSHPPVSPPVPLPKMHRMPEAPRTPSST